MRFHSYRPPRFVLLLLLLTAGGCDLGGLATKTPGGVELVTTPELTSYRTAIAQRLEDMTWIERGQAGKGWRDVPEALAAAQQAIHSAAPRLAAVDYTALSLPDFITATRSLKMEAATFDGRDLTIDAFGQGKQSSDRYILYRWQGPEIPQRPDRPLVHRWLRVYALYDTTQTKMVRLLATIGGEARE